MVTKTDNKNKFLTYKGKPLVRSGNTIYYGNAYDKYLIKIDIKSSKRVQNLEMADKVIVYLISISGKSHENRKIIKSSEKPNLYAAIDIADAWLEKALSED